MLEKIRQRLNSRTYKTTFWLTVITAIELNAQLLTQFLPAEYRLWAIFVWPMAMIFLREITTTALSEK